MRTQVGKIAPKGLRAYASAVIRGHVIHALNVGERLRRRLAYIRVRDDRPRVLAQGDSWFCYPLPGVVDTLQHLQGDQGFAVRTLAAAARRAWEMATPWAINTLQNHIHRERPSTVLLSMGGNDVLDLLNAKARREPGAGVTFDATTPNYLSHTDLDPIFQRVKNHVHMVVQACFQADPNLRAVVLVGYDLPHVRAQPDAPIFESLELARVPAQSHLATAHALMNLLLDHLAECAKGYDRVYFFDYRGLAPDSAAWPDEIHADSAGYGRGAQTLAEFLRAL